MRTLNFLIEDEFFPRVDTLIVDFTSEASILPIEHQERFRPGDIVRVGVDDFYDTGEFDEYGNPILRVHNEHVQIVNSYMKVNRGVGVNPPQDKPKGDRVYIIAASLL